MMILVNISSEKIRNLNRQLTPANNSMKKEGLFVTPLRISNLLDSVKHAATNLLYTIKILTSFMT